MSWIPRHAANYEPVHSGTSTNSLERKFDEFMEFIEMQVRQRKTGWVCAHFGLEVDLPALKGPLSLGIYRDAVPRYDISEFPSYNFEKKFLWCDKKGLKGSGTLAQQRLGIIELMRLSSRSFSLFRNSSCITLSPFARRRCQFL